MHFQVVLIAVALGLDSPESSKPLRVAVIEAGTGQPVKQFSYRYSYKTAGRSRGFGERWTAVESADGTFVVEVPVSCRLSLEIKGRDHVGGRAAEKEIIVRSKDDPGRIATVSLTRGSTDRGVVRDLETKKPILGATVKATVPGGMLIMADDEWAVTTDAQGRYELRGVDPTFPPHVSHPAYAFDELGSDGKELERLKFAAVRDVYLKKRAAAPPIHGVARLANGTPLEGVSVIDGNQFRGDLLTKSGKDGSFTIRDPRMEYLYFRKDGLISRELVRWKDEFKEGQQIDLVMAPQTPLIGRVIAPDGSPVSSFTISAGTEPVTGNTDHVEKPLTDPSGRFSLGLDHTGRNWVGVRADGFAVWDGFVDVAKGGPPLQVRLDGGVTLSARIVAPMREKGEVHAELVPRRDKTRREWGLSGDLCEEQFSTLKCEVAADGTLRLPHVRPDRYFLSLQGPTVTPRRFAIDVPARDFDLGEISLAGRGRIVGRVFRPENQGGGPWEFVWGEVSSPAIERFPGVGFTSDEDGRFVIEGVPEGNSDVRFLTQLGCVISGPSWTARVQEGRTTEVHAFEPGKEHPLTVALLVGDGSIEQFASGSGLSPEQLKRPDEPGNPRFSIGLRSLRPGPSSYHDMQSELPDAGGRLTLRDADPGDYRLRLFESGGAGVLFDRSVTSPSKEPIRVPLGAGSIVGKWIEGDRFGRTSTVRATPLDRSKPSRIAEAGEAGYFRLRFLEPGVYAVTAHDPEKGWGRIDDVVVGREIKDVGAVAPKSKGGAIAVSVRFPGPSAVPDEVVATDGDGNEVSKEFLVYSGFDALTIPGLWPGRWTVRAKAAGEVVATGATVLIGTETMPLELLAGASELP